MNLVVLLLLLVPTAALADPVTFTAVLTTLGQAAAAFSISNALAILSLGASIYASSAARKKQRRAAARARADYNASLQDRNITALGASPSWRVIYGRCVTGGDVVAILTSDKAGVKENGTAYTKPDGLKHVVIEFAHHECEAIHEIYIDGVPLGELDSEGRVISGEFLETRTDTRMVEVPAGGFLDVPTPVLEVLSAGYQSGSGDNPSFSDIAVTLSVGNTRITNPDGVNVATVTYTTDTTTSQVRVSKHLGAADQAVDAYLNSVKPTECTVNHRMRGATYIALTLDLENTRFQGGPPNVTADISGRKVYDPRTSTTAWSDNNALCIRDWLLAPWGYNVTTSDIDDTYTTASANACDVETVFNTINVLGVTVPVTGPQYTCNGSFTSADAKESVLSDLEESMAGHVVYGAQYMIQAGVWSAPVTLPGGGGLTDDDLDGQIEVLQAGASMDDLFNGLRGSYIPAGKSVPVDIRPPYSNSVFVEADGEALWQDIALPFTDTGPRARNIARVLTERARSAQIIRYPAKMRAITLRVGDRVSVTSAEYGYPAKLWRVTDRQFSLASPVILTLQEDAEEIYDQADAAVADPTPNTNLPSPWAVTAVTGLSAFSSSATMVRSGSEKLVPRVLVFWDDITDGYVLTGGHFEVLWRSSVDEQWQQVNVAGDETSTFLMGAEHDDRILIEVRAVNALGKRGASAFISHRVVGEASTSGGGGTIYRQVSEPAGVQGDLWFDTGDSNKLYMFDGGAWVLVRDAGISAALLAAANAQSTADGKIESFFQTTAPGSASEGDLWFDTDDGNKQYIWTAGAWVLAADTRIGQAITAAALAQATADGKIETFFQPSAPGSAAEGDLWIDTDDNNKLYIRTGGGLWLLAADERIGQAITAAATAQSTADGKIDSFFQTSAPGSASEGDLWFDTDDNNKVYVRTGGSWVIAADTRIATAITNAATAQSTADGKIITFFGGDMPTATAVGDLWFDNSTGRFSRWNGSAWVTQSAIGSGDVLTSHLESNAVDEWWVAFDATGVFQSTIV